MISKRFRKTKLMAQLLQMAPFVRVIILNGSLAQGKSSQKSDIDLLIIIKRGRLFTARLFVIVLAFLTGQKRSKDENKAHAGKFCFNYFLADNYLKIPTGRGKKMDQYCADNYYSSLLVWGEEKTFEKFKSINQNLFTLADPKYSQSNYAIEKDIFPVRDWLGLIIIKRCKEWALGGKFGDWFEKRIKILQIKMIEKDPRTKKTPDLIVYNDLEARFHPPKEQH